MTDRTEGRAEIRGPAAGGGRSTRGALWLAGEANARLAARRWLVAAAALVVGAFIAFAALPWKAGVAGVVIFALAAALLPRDRLARRAHERPREDTARQQAIERYREILQALPDPAILLSHNGSILSYNARARDHFAGLRRGSHVSVAIRHPEILDAIPAAQRAGKPVTVYFAERVPVERRIEATVTLLPTAQDAAGAAGAAAAGMLLVSMRDLTEQERINQMRADFITNASHELRTPLASVLGFIETLQGPARDDPKARERFLAIMASQAERMRRLIDDLLSLSRVEMNVHLQPQGTVDLKQTVAHVADTLEPLARERSISITVEALAEEALVRGDHDEIVQVIQNLTQNAIKYGRDGGHVTLRVVAEGDAAKPDAPRRIALSVVDDGVGIAPEHLPRLTERFYRVDVASSREKGGTGLGLAIVKHVVNRHRGELRIASQPGKGSTFTVFLPVAEGERTGGDSGE